MTKRKVPLGPIQRGGVALPFLDRGIKMTIPDPALARLVADAVGRLRNCNQATDIERLAAELTRSIQAGILMDQVPEFDRMTDKQKLAQLDALDAAIVRLDEAFGQLRRETWAEVVSVNPDLPPMPSIVREGVYNVWRGLHEAVRESRRRLQGSASDRGPRPNGPPARAADEAGKVYEWITGKEPKVYWDDAACEYKGKCLPFMTEIFAIFGIEGNPAHYAKKN